MSVIDQIYRLRQDFIVIGLTGRTGSGCSTIAQVLAETKFANLKTEYKEFRNGEIDNNVRKSRIVYNYMKEHWHPFTIIKASDVIFYYALLLDDFDTFINNLFLTTSTDTGKVGCSPDDAINKGIKDSIVSVLKGDFDALHQKVVACDDYLNNKEYRNDATKIGEYEKLILEQIPTFRYKLNSHLVLKFRKMLGKDLQRWGNNIRNFNSVEPQMDINERSPSCLADKINQFIKMFRTKDKESNPSNPTLIVIDALRNPYEILYFRERYSAFYTISVNTEEAIRKNNLALVNYHFTVRPSGHDPIPLRENQNRKGKWRQAKSTTTR